MRQFIHNHYLDDHPIVRVAIWRELKRANLRFADNLNARQIAEQQGRRFVEQRVSRYSGGGERALMASEWLDEKTGMLQMFADIPPRPKFARLVRIDPWGAYAPGNVGWAPFVTAHRDAVLSHCQIRDLLWRLHVDREPVPAVAAAYGLTIERIRILKQGGGTRVDCGVYAMPELGEVVRRTDPWPQADRKFSASHVLQMRAGYERGYSLRFLANEFMRYYTNVTPSEVRSVVRGDTYKDIGGPLAGYIRREKQADAVNRIARERRAAYLYSAKQIAEMRDAHALFGATPRDLAKAHGGTAADVAPWLKPEPVTHTDPISGAQTLID